VSVTASAGLTHSECGEARALNKHLGITEDPAHKAGFFFVNRLHMSVFARTHTQEFYMNAFELRYQLLESAKSMLEGQFHATMHLWDLTGKAGEPPKFPSFQDILDRAAEMNKFISESK